ncbi:RagB/SusD family nutrient uptake outer membrane protein [Maribellus sp. CM-23]|uniref:RagB/SusD family nutrient uptake outer membrane protein n=1 Tax=Maribellus sp. CM-23 TaxID=2781026 RepID=UPI001F27DC9B|nr:RagB/SusD family nutrient uptake outer membrane protein [Maribellus sp. CM-23]MCE4563190.1 RagB/SusD family nutrient uptake outer membrane protein [Maribellus sp. CM-23]
MKNKKILSLVFVIAFSFLYQGCTNLDEEVFDKLPVDEFGNTESQINSLIAPIYRTLKNVFPSNYFLLSECSADMAVTPTRKGGDWWDGGQFKELRFHTWTPNTSLVKSSYNAAMESISSCNKIYSMIEENESIGNKEVILAEIRGVRAYWYYLLLDYYGNVPIVTDFKDTSNPVTKPRSEVYQFVLTELNAIKDVVREDVTAASYGKITKGVVYTLLAKMYLNALVWYPEGGAKWQECADACDEVMDLGYVFEPNFKASFVVQNQNSKEIIFPVVFSTADGGNHIHKRTLHYLDPIPLNLKVGTWNGVSAMPQYIKDYDEEDKRVAWSFLLGPMYNTDGSILITAHGRQLIHTVDIELKYNLDEDGWGQVEQEEGGRCSKWEFESGLNGDMENDLAIFRLADVYLMKAEALVRLGKENDEATRLVNLIRGRAFDNASKLLGSTTLDDIYKERRFELAWESSARQDMIRFGTFLDEIPGWKGVTPEKCLLFPIPQTALDANPELDQNPGY